MKRVIILLCTVFAYATASMAQTWKITKTDGTVVAIPYYEVASVTVTEEDTHQYVDLGLPSGTMWAACNIGASAPWEYGDYFAWGETSGYNSGKTYFVWDNYAFSKDNYNTLTKYCYDSSYGNNGYVDDLKELETCDDAAYVNWGSEWRMPSAEQFEELFNSKYTTTSWTTRNGVAGRLVTSEKTGNSIFLPAAGKYGFDTYVGEGSIGTYWSRSINAEYPFPADCMVLYDFRSSINDDNRCFA